MSNGVYRGFAERNQELALLKICIGNLYSEGCEANLTEFLEVPYTIYPRISRDNKYYPPLQPV